MTTALQTIQPTVTTDQVDLIKRTIAADATPDELKLYLFDCARQGVHPLDKLLHFTKRKGKYTPITSIDFMRIRAAETGEYAGSDDAIFAPPLPTAPHPPAAATVTVYRLVQGQRCAFSATARWSEYKPDQDFMWMRMPHTMLSKCAEALALRKGFPRQLAGLYASEEMDQADVTEARRSLQTTSDAACIPHEQLKSEMGGYATVPAPPPPDAAPRPELPDGVVFIERIDSSPTKNPKVLKYFVTLSNGVKATTINQWLVSLAEQLCQDAVPVRVKTEETRWGPELKTITRADEPAQPTLESVPTEDEAPF